MIKTITLILLIMLTACAVTYNNDPYDELQPKWFIVNGSGQTILEGPYISETKCASAKFASGEWNDSRVCKLLK